MQQKDLISKLNSLKNISPDSAWIKSNRELFLAQISNSGASELSAWQIFFINFKSVIKASSQPAFALTTFMVVLVASSIFSHKIFSQAKPNDSLYIARIISEKAKLNTVLDFQERNKMAVKFAADHAKDITTVLSDPSFNNEENKDQVAKLNDSFNEEMDTIKNRMVSLATAPTNHKKETAKTDSNKLSEEAVSIATENKTDKGIQISTNEEEIKLPALSATATVKTNAPLENATSSENIKENITDEAKDLLGKKEYKNVIDKLNEVDEIIKQEIIKE
ncbi:MAG: hypothetical protein WCT50_03100 [Patescibacteria group bacterium]